MIVRTCLARMPLSEVDRDADLARAFDPSERAALAGRPDRSVAGRLALKQALSDLWADLAPGVPADPRDFVLDTLASGAPCLRSAPAGVPVPSVRVSISHSRHLAVGLAAAPVPESPRAHRQGEP